MPKEIILTEQEYKELITVLEKAEQMAEDMRQLSLDIRIQKFRLYNKFKSI
jgi:sensor histidine kinase YesM